MTAMPKPIIFEAATKPDKAAVPKPPLLAETKSDTGAVIHLPKPKGQSFITRLSAAGKNWFDNTLPMVLVVAGLLLAWQIVMSGENAQFPSPTDVWRDSRELIMDPFFDRGGTDKGLFWHISSSLSRVAVGFSFAAILGVICGVLLGAVGWLHRGFDPIVQVLRTVPPLAWLPISLALFQQANPSALFVIVITAIWPIIINTAIGVRNIPSDYVNVGRVLSLSPLEYFIKILLPASLPYIFAGLRIAIGMSWLAIVASEMLLGGVGIGFFIWDQYNASRISDILVGLLYVGMVGFMLDRLVAFAGSLISRGTLQN